MTAVDDVEVVGKCSKFEKYLFPFEDDDEEDEEEEDEEDEAEEEEEEDEEDEDDEGLG